MPMGFCVTSIFKAQDWLRERAKTWTGVQILIPDLWAYFSQCFSEKLIIRSSREALDVSQHIFMTLVQHSYTGAADWKSRMFSFQV